MNFESMMTKVYSRDKLLGILYSGVMLCFLVMTFGCQNLAKDHFNLDKLEIGYSDQEIVCITHTLGNYHDSIDSVDSIFETEGDKELMKELRKCGYKQDYFSARDIADIVLIFSSKFGKTDDFVKATKLLFLLDDGENAGFFAKRFPSLEQEYRSKPQEWLLK